MGTLCGGAVRIDHSRNLEGLLNSPRRSQAPGTVYPILQPKSRLVPHLHVHLPASCYLSPCAEGHLTCDDTLPSLGAIAVPHKPSSQLL